MNTINALIIFAHPVLEGSFNGAVLASAQEALIKLQASFRVRPLVQQGFNPVINQDEMEGSFRGVVPADCIDEQIHISWADTLIFITPAWNFSIPAILKGYIDRVLMIPGFSLDMGPNGTDYQGGLLQGKRALVVQTLGSRLASGYKYGSIATYMAPMVSSLYYAGIQDVRTLQVWNLYNAGDSNRALEQVSDFFIRMNERGNANCELISAG
jgi:NAD(P)H dehydrogenase (quinone)